MRVPTASIVTALALHAVPTPRLPAVVLSATATAPLFDFTGPAAESSLEAWERIDDVIMGGVSSSRLVALPRRLLPATSSEYPARLRKAVPGSGFEGRIREDGGGFCGTRMRLLAEPIDLSASEGLYLDCEIPADALESMPDPSKRVWKMAIRTKQDRGEVVYQQTFTPPSRGRKVIKLPFDGFRLVRGPRLVPGAPPLSAAQANQTYQISIVVSKFTVSDSGAALPDFVEGPFALHLFSVGTYGAGAAAAIAPATPAASALPKPLTKEEQNAAAPLAVKLLRPLLSVLFGETTRRRRAATKLLQVRGSTRLARAKLGWAWRSASGGALAGLRRTSAVALQDGAAAALALPIRLLFKLVGLVAKALKLAKRATGGGGGGGGAVQAPAPATQS